jgi:hypothetical protein
VLALNISLHWNTKLPSITFPFIFVFTLHAIEIGVV